MRALSRKYANRKSLLRNLITSFILYERIKTTTAKGKEIKPIMERLLTVAKANDLTARRRLMAYLFDENAVKKMLEVYVPRFKNIKSGFIKTYRLGARLGDGADMIILELVEGEKEIPKEENAKPQKGSTEKSIGKASTTKKTSAKAGK